MKNMLLLISLIFTCTVDSATTGYIYLNGTVPVIQELTVTSESIAGNLPLDTTQNNTKIALLNVKSNVSSGFKVTVSSSNSGKLIHSNDNNYFIQYSLKYDNSPLNIQNGSDFFINTTGVSDINYDIKISYTGVPHSTLKSGNYTDTLTFTVTAN